MKTDIPDLLRSEWRGGIPIDTAIRAAGYLWHCSKCGHEWLAELKHRLLTLARNLRQRNGRTGCPGCHQVHQRGPLPQHLVEEWDEPAIKIENASRDWREQRRYRWKCAVGHRWIASLYRRLTKKTGCPTCSRRKKGECLKTTLLAMSLASIDLDSCSPTPEECGRATVAVHAMELRCGDLYASPTAKANAPECQEAIEARQLWESKCR